MIRHLTNMVVVVRIALLALLICAQGVTLAHEIDHGIAHEGNVCAVCSIGGGLSSAVTGDHSCPVHAAKTEFLPTVVELPAAKRLIQTREARAPPASS